MRFSIIVPVYNGAEYLRRCIASVQKQSISDWQLILVNDGSTDESGSIMSELAKQDKRLFCIHQENTGPFFARKKGIACAKGDYLLFLDCDDCLAEPCLETLNTVITEHHPDMICFAAVSDNTVIGQLSKEKTWLDKELFCRVLMSSHRFNSLWSKCFRRELLENDDNHYDAFRGICWGEDKAMLLHPTHRAKNIYCLPDILYSYQRNPKGISKIASAKQIDAMISQPLFDLLEKYRILWKIESHSLKCYQLENLLNAYWRSVRSCKTREEWNLFFAYPWHKQYQPLKAYGRYLKGNDRWKLTLAWYLYKRRRV